MKIWKIMIFSPNILVFFVCFECKIMKSAPAAEGGGDAIKLSAEIMVNRAAV